MQRTVQNNFRTISSPWLSVTARFPQESIVEPLLIIYVDDLHIKVKGADETNGLISTKKDINSPAPGILKNLAATEE